MSGHLEPLGQPTRTLAVVACAVAAIVALGMAAFVLAVLIQKGEFAPGGKPVWAGLLVLVAIGFASAWIAVRLSANRSSNGVTILPFWFIEAFGLVLLAMSVWVTINRGWQTGIPSCIGVALAMILVRVHARRSRRENSANASEPQALESRTTNSLDPTAK
jgi:hypothetical protein